MPVLRPEKLTGLLLALGLVLEPVLEVLPLLELEFEFDPVILTPLIVMGGKSPDYESGDPVGAAADRPW
jgi:hypothetical protein